MERCGDELRVRLVQIEQPDCGIHCRGAPKDGSPCGDLHRRRACGACLIATAIHWLARCHLYQQVDHHGGRTVGAMTVKHPPPGVPTHAEAEFTLLLWDPAVQDWDDPAATRIRQSCSPVVTSRWRPARAVGCASTPRRKDLTPPSMWSIPSEGRMECCGIRSSSCFGPYKKRK
jgi:hypothetical protein